MQNIALSICIKFIPHPRLVKCPTLIIIEPFCSNALLKIKNDFSFTCILISLPIIDNFSIETDFQGHFCPPTTIIVPCIFHGRSMFCFGASLFACFQQKKMSCPGLEHTTFREEVKGLKLMHLFVSISLCNIIIKI